MLQEELLDRQAAAEAGLPLRLANAEVVTAQAQFRGGVTVVDGIIAEVEEGGAVPDDAIDCRGELLLPGLVYLQTDH
jgi:alpha-D-ribose 1-methylphosphonate 5-triphosphate diphosphatase